MPKAKAEIRSLARSHTEAAIKVLAGVMNQKKTPPAARVSAAVALLDRGWGKPTQMIADDPEGEPLAVETDQRDIRELARETALILYRADKEAKNSKGPKHGPAQTRLAQLKQQ